MMSIIFDDKSNQEDANRDKLIMKERENIRWLRWRPLSSKMTLIDAVRRATYYLVGGGRLGIYHLECAFVSASHLETSRRRIDIRTHRQLEDDGGDLVVKIPSAGWPFLISPDREKRKAIETLITPLPLERQKSSWEFATYLIGNWR